MAHPTDPLLEGYAYDEGAEDNWLISYADLLTNLLAFFVLLFAVSTVQSHRFEALSRTFSFDAQQEVSMTQAKARLDALAQNQAIKESFETALDSEGLAIRMRDELLFPSASADVSPSGEALLGRVSEVLTSLGPPHVIVVEGHADDLPIHTPQFSSNWELSAQRSVNVVKRLIEHGVGPRRISAQAFGDTQPASVDDRAKNRRVVVRVR